MAQKPHHIWQERLYSQLFQQPYPLFVFDDGVVPAASMWFLMREWVNIFREAKLSAGSRIVIDLPPTRAFVAVLLAGMWERMSIALCSPSFDSAEVASYLDASAIITQKNDETVLQTRTSSLAPIPDIRLLLASSGTTGQPRWFALSDKNIFSVIDSHLPHLGLMSPKTDTSQDSTMVSDYPAARILSVLPLYHAFGLIIDFLPAVFAGAEIVRDAQNGRNLDTILKLSEAHGITHCSMVPLLAQRLGNIEDGRGRQFLSGLQGGVIGGAAVSEELVPLLRQTKLRVGYGQTEASPGILLGERGVWTANYLGKPLPKPLGCDVRIRPDVLSGENILEFRGANACIGAWTEKGFEPMEQERWHSTGDIVEISTDAAFEGLVFRGRIDDNFKLANGRFIPAVQWESLLKSRIESCLEAMITTVDGEYCSLALMYNQRPDLEKNQNSDPELLQILQETLGTAYHLISRIHHFSRDEWCFTPKGSTDRRAMGNLLLSFLNN